MEAPSRLAARSIASRIPAFPKGMVPNVYGWVWNALFKFIVHLTRIISSENDFRRGGPVSPCHPPTEPPTPAERRADGGYL